MRTTQQMSITLSDEFADLVRNKVASGEGPGNSEDVQGGLRALLALDCAVETWLREEVVPEYDRVLAGESEGASSDQLRARLGLNY